MGKARIRKKLEGHKKQIIKHIKKFKEAEEKGAAESMNYMAKELSNYLKRIEDLKSRMLPKKFRKKKI